jgi:hypothetical protein
MSLERTSIQTARGKLMYTHILYTYTYTYARTQILIYSHRPSNTPQLQPIVGMWISGRLREHVEETAVAPTEPQEDAPATPTDPAATAPRPSQHSLVAGGSINGSSTVSSSNNSPLSGMQAAAASKSSFSAAAAKSVSGSLGASKSSAGAKSKAVSEEAKKQKREASAAAIRERVMQPQVNRRAQIIMDEDDD